MISVCRAFDVEQITRRHDQIQVLFSAVHEQAKFRVAALPEDYFASLPRHLGEQFTMDGYFLDDKLVGFTSSIHWGDQTEGHYLGLDYEHNVAHAIYQNILYDDVQGAIERGSRELNLGRTALEMKSAIGAEPRPVSCFMRHRNPASNAIVRPLFGFAKPTKWRPRNPFGS